MKKLIALLLFLLLLTSCSEKKETINYTYEPQYKSVDMSGYEGVSSTNHMFRLTLPSEMFKVIEEKSSAVFYLGRENCPCCQRCIKHLEAVAEELGVYVYYIDVYNEEEPCTNEEMINKLHDTLLPILDEMDGEKVVLTPHVFAVINGEFKGSLVCTQADYNVTSPTDKQVKELRDIYRSILEPFSNN